MEGNSQLPVPSNLESTLMPDVSDPQQGIGSGGSGSSLGGSITACRKVLRNNSLLESTDYWLQSQRTPCQIGFVEDKSENCASVCFVNLDIDKAACTTEGLQQKLVNVSPDLPKLINSMNVQQPKENEIVLLSGLASGNLQAEFEVPQCPWLSDVCLVQCARGNRPNSTNCIIFEINKFLIGLELVQERQLHLETNVLKLEDDTNCSLSSIEEDFLTASEHLEEESEVEECRNGFENINVSVSVLESKKPKEATQEEWNCSKERMHYTLEDNYISKYHMPLSKMEGSQGDIPENVVLQSLTPLAKPSQRKEEMVRNKHLATNYCSADFKGQVENSQAQYIPNESYFSVMVKKDVPSHDTVTEKGSSLDAGDHEGESLPPIQDEEGTTGDYATNLAESVLQDAFIRLSQAQPALPQESAVSVSIGSALLPSGCSTKDTVVPRSWSDLPRIVIVQSPEGGDVTSEAGVTSYPQTEVSGETSGVLSGESSGRHPQSAVEVALACAATVIGTISSPQATERLTMEQESLISLRGSGALQNQVPQGFKEPSTSEYSFPSALCGMTQVASAVAICGLGEREGLACLPAGASEHTPSICSSVAESNMELGKEAIAEALLRETTVVLARPDAYSNLGDLMGSLSRRIIETTSNSLCSENILRSELAQNLSSVILKHCIDEVRQKNEVVHSSEGMLPCETLDSLMECASQLLHSVMCLTVKKMGQIVHLGESPTTLSKEPLRQTETDPLGCQAFDQAAGQAWSKATANSSGHLLSNAHSTGLVVHELVDDAHPKPEKGGARAGLCKNPVLRSELSCSHRVLDSSTAKTFPKDIYLRGIIGGDMQNLRQIPIYDSREWRGSKPVATYSRSSREAEDSIDPNTSEKCKCSTPINNEAQVNLSLLGDDLAFPAHSMLQEKHSELYYITDFAEELAETVVSMATEIAAICLDNSNGKQPWFCAWNRGNEFLAAPNTSCWSVKRRKEVPSSGSAVRKHKPPRLSEIKRKTDEHPELKEKLMNRVMDESMNLEDIPDSVNLFANEVAAKIMNLTEFSMVDGGWQAQNCSRNRLLSGDRWNRLKASSCESIPEEDSEARVYVNSLGLMSTLSQPVSRASSVSKQSSCESITDEFSRFMVNQMENEGRGFELLLDYYAGKNASSILSSAMQQACRKNEYISVRPSCPSKQSSTESITEEFYRYMLRDIEKESRDGPSSRRSSQDWTSGLLSPSSRSPLCCRQSSMPDSRSPCSRLTVNAPMKANSLDGFAQNFQQDFLSVQPVSRASSSGLCKSDSCLYRRGGTDHITDMLIHETWASSIEALMRKNKIIVDNEGTTEAGAVSGGSPVQMDKCANRVATNRVHRGPTLLVQECQDYPRKDVVTESKHSPVSSPNKKAPTTSLSGLDSSKDAGVVCRPRQLLCSRDVPVIQIEADQKEEGTGEPEPFLPKSDPLGDAEENPQKEPAPDVARGSDTAMTPCQNHSDSMETRDVPEAEVSTEVKAPDEFPNPPSSSEESTGSWSQLANEDDNADDTSSFLQLSEHSMSELVEEKEILKEQSQSLKENASGQTGRAASPQRSLLVINFDLEPERPDAELRATLQWIAASELGIPTIYFKKSQESRIEKFLDVVRLVHQKSWKVGDIFHAVVQYCKMHAEQKERTPSLFDWLLELG